MATKHDISVLVSSCDQYEDAWYPFFALLKKHWDCPYPIYLNTETKRYCDFGVIPLNCGAKKISWSLRLKKALKKIKSKYVILFLEDFFLLEDVDKSEIDRCLNIMEKERRISKIEFDYSNDRAAIPSQYDGYRIRSERGMYWLNCQTAIWRRKDLIRYLSPRENPWQFELFGTERAKLYGKQFLFTESDRKLPFQYVVERQTGYGIWHGKWLKSNIQLFQKNGISVPFENLGFYEGELKGPEPVCQPPEKSMAERWMYFLYGGGEKIRTEILEQICFFFRHPKKAGSILKRKLKFLFTSDRNPE